MIYLSFLFHHNDNNNDKMIMLMTMMIPLDLLKQYREQDLSDLKEIYETSVGRNKVLLIRVYLQVFKYCTYFEGKVTNGRILKMLRKFRTK